MAWVGQCLAQLPQVTLSFSTTQFFFIHTAWPICRDDLSALSIFRMAPVGHTSEHMVHSGRQKPRLKSRYGCMKWCKSVEGFNTSLGHCDTHSWQDVQCWARCSALSEPGGVIWVPRRGVTLSSILARPPSTFFSSWAIVAVVVARTVPRRKFRREALDGPSS